MGFNKGDKVVCVNDIPDDTDWIVDLTIGNIYEVYNDSVIEVLIVNDDCEPFQYYKTYRFISINEYRNEIINKVLDL